MPTKQELLDLLHQGPVQVRFTKTDGTKRVMLCTLVESYLPARTGSGTAKPKPDTIVPVWSIIDQGWRSIRVESVESAKPVDVNG